MFKKKKFWLLNLIVLCILLLSSLITIIIIFIPKSIRLEKEMGYLVSSNTNDNPDLKSLKSINMLILGDSIGAGYNPYQTENTGDYLEKRSAYSNFLYESLKQKKVGKEFNLLNEAESGKKIIELVYEISKSDYDNELKESNLIFLNIGANDLLAATDIMTLESNPQDLLDKANKIIKLKSSIENDYYNKEEIKKSGIFDNIIGINKMELESRLKDVFSGYNTIIRKINEKNPKARVVIMGYAFPFETWDRAFTEIYKYGYLGKINGTDYSKLNLKNIFSNFSKIQKYISDKYKFVDYFNPYDYSDFRYTNPKIKELLPNPGDIHPSVQGHYKIADLMFKELISKKMGIEYKDDFIIKPVSPSDENIKNKDIKLIDFNNVSNKEENDNMYNLTKILVGEEYANSEKNIGGKIWIKNTVREYTWFNYYDKIWG